MRAFLVVALALASVPDAGPSAAGYQATRWGMSEKEVRKLAPGAKADKFGSFKSLRVAATVSGLQAVVAYVFDNGTLQMVRVVFVEPRSAAEDVVADFERVDEALSGKYGEGSEKKTMWKGDDQAMPIPAALARGDVELGRSWKVPGVFVIHQVSKSDGALFHFIDYLSPAGTSIEARSQQEGL